MIASMVAVEVFAPPGTATIALQGGVATVAVVAAALWVRGNRVALDLENWCRCSGEKTTIRVIPSRRRDEPVVVVDPNAPVRAERAHVDEGAPVSIASDAR